MSNAPSLPLKGATVLTPRKGWVLAMLTAPRLRVAPLPPTAPLPSAARGDLGELVGSEERPAFGVSPKNGVEDQEGDLTMPFTAWFALGLVALLFMPGVEVLASMLAWAALLFGVGIWLTTGFDAAAGVLALVPFALVLRFLRLRVAVRFW